jgi:hypothetical protein
MAEASTPTPGTPIGGYTTHTLKLDELDEWNRQAEARRASIRAGAMLMIGRDPEGRPLASPDDAEEQRLDTTDLRGALRQAQQERCQVSLRGLDQKDALGRAQAHLEAAQAELRQLEEHAAAGERAAADRLVASFRVSEIEPPGPVSSPATSEIDTARLAVQRVEAAVERLTSEAEATNRELVRAQTQVGLHVLDVVRHELLAIAGQVEDHDRAAAVLRANMQAAGFVTGNLQRRRGWQGVRIFTRRMLAALHYQPPDRPAAASVDWEAFIARLYDDPEAELEAKAQLRPVSPSLVGSPRARR